VSKNDRDLGMNRAIPRRDFLNGVSIAVGSTVMNGGFPGLEWIAEAVEEQFPQDKAGYYPPTLTGMRGSHDGSFEAAHLLRDGDFWKNNRQPTSTGETFDLVVVGGGISGLAAAYFYRKKDPAARILVLDNHDDFGGHAKRNEFHHRERMLLANGGTVSIESPFPYSKEAHGLLSELGIDPAALEAKCLDREVYKGLKPSVFFNKETFGTDRLVVGTPAGRFASPGAASAASWTEFVAKTPLPEAVQRDIVRVQEGKADYLPGLSSEEKKRAALAHEFQRFSSKGRQSRSRRDSVLPDAYPRSVRSWHRRGFGDGLLGDWLPGISRHESCAGAAPSHGLYGHGRGYPGKRAVPFSFSGWQRIDCAHAGEGADSERGCGTDGGGHRHRKNGLHPAG